MFLGTQVSRQQHVRAASFPRGCACRHCIHRLNLESACRRSLENVYSPHATASSQDTDGALSPQTSGEISWRQQQQLPAGPSRGGSRHGLDAFSKLDLGPEAGQVRSCCCTRALLGVRLACFTGSPSPSELLRPPAISATAAGASSVWSLAVVSEWDA